MAPIRHWKCNHDNYRCCIPLSSGLGLYSLLRSVKVVTGGRRGHRYTELTEVPIERQHSICYLQSAGMPRVGLSKYDSSLTEQTDPSNRMNSSGRVEHVVGVQASEICDTLMQTVGVGRARTKVGIKNLAYETRCVVQLCRMSARPHNHWISCRGKRHDTLLCLAKVSKTHDTQGRQLSA